MATKPNETYKWGENATHEQVAAYEDTGWPSDVIPPKRTQFNWYQNLIGRWLGWIEETVLDRWFTIIYGAGSGGDWKPSIPKENGLYEYRATIPSLGTNEWFVTVTNGTAIAVQVFTDTNTTPTHFNLEFATWDIGLNEWVSKYTFNRANSRSDVLQETESDYVTPKGLVDYFRVDEASYGNTDLVPPVTGMYIVGSENASLGISFVRGDLQVLYPTNPSLDVERFKWNGSAWVAL